jgi:hypothetical protein
MTQAQQQRKPDRGVAMPKAFEVRVDGARHGAFVEVRDAIDAAKIVKREHPQSIVGVHDAATGQVVVEADD